MYEFSNVDEISLISEGTYEVVIDNAEIKISQNSGNRYIAVRFRIRNDVEQPFQNAVVFENIWPDKDNPDQFDHRRLQKLLLVQGPQGRYSFADDDELVQFINGLTLSIVIEAKEPDDYHADKYNQVKFLSYKPSKAQPKTLEQRNAEALEYGKKVFGDNLQVVDNEPTDDDLPF